MSLKEAWAKAPKYVKVIVVVFVLAVVANVFHPSHKDEAPAQTAQTNTPNSVKNTNLAKIDSKPQEQPKQEAKQMQEQAPNYKYIFKQDFARLVGVEVPAGSALEMNRIGDDFVRMSIDVVENGKTITVEGLYYAKDGKLINFTKGHDVLYSEK